MKRGAKQQIAPGELNRVGLYIFFMFIGMEAIQSSKKQQQPESVLHGEP